MFANLEALIALAEMGTMTRAAAKLHVTQSAISKRIAALEQELGTDLVQRVGRRVELTPRAFDLLQRAEPLIAELKQSLTHGSSDTSGAISLAVSGSVLMSWGAEVLAAIKQTHPEIEIHAATYNATRSVEAVVGGDVMLALCHGIPSNIRDLWSAVMCRDEMVIVPKGLSTLFFPDSGELELMGTDESTDTRKALERALSNAQRHWEIKFAITGSLNTFPAVLQMARAGFGHGVVPRSLALSFGLVQGDLIPFPAPGLSLPVRLVARRSTMAVPVVLAFHDALKAEIGKRFSSAVQ